MHLKEKGKKQEKNLDRNKERRFLLFDEKK